MLVAGSVAHPMLRTVSSEVKCGYYALPASLGNSSAVRFVTSYASFLKTFGPIYPPGTVKKISRVLGSGTSLTVLFRP